MSTSFFECSNNSNEKTMKVLMVIGALIILYSFISMNKKKTINGGNKEKISFILYYVDWCPHCKSIKPEWSRLEKDIEFKDILISKINCEENTEVVKKLDIEGYPTILFTKNGKTEPYNGGREYSDFKEFLKSQKSRNM